MYTTKLSLLAILIGFFWFAACAESTGANTEATATTATAANSTSNSSIATAGGSASATSSTSPVISENVVAEPSKESATNSVSAPKTGAPQPAAPATKPPSPPKSSPGKKTPVTASASPIPTPPSPPAEPANAPTTAVLPPARPDHAIWDQLLRQHVSGTGKVNYAGLEGQKKQLEAYLSELATTVPTGDWSRNEAMAYWINAYNAFTVQLILDNWPVKSIKEISGGDPWAVKWIELAGQKYSLNQIENDILRPKYGDARIHFAVNCAAISCPPLYNRAFTAANLTTNLDRLARAFINNERYNTISAETAEVSKIFDWYGVDFGTLHEYLAKYAEASLDANTQISFKTYDWALNN